MKRKSNNFSKFFGDNLIFIGILLTFAVPIIQLIYTLGISATLSCIKQEPKHISCQLEKSHWYGLESIPIEKFKLTKADIVVVNDGDDITNEKLVLYDNNRPIDFYEDRQRDLRDTVHLDKEKINKFILEAKEKQTLTISSYGFIRVLKTATQILLIISLVFIPVCTLILFQHRSKLLKTNRKK